MFGKNARMPFTTPRTLTSHTQRQSSALTAQDGPVIETPRIVEQEVRAPRTARPCAPQALPTAS